MEKPWTCIVFTCANATWNRVIKGTLLGIRKRKIINSLTNETKILAATDPGTNIGSGAATLNALYVVTEYLSALRNYTVATADVLQDANVLILHHGRGYCFDIGGKGLIQVPTYDLSNDGLCFEVHTNLEHLVSIMSSLKNKSSSCGIWVCSTDVSFVQCSIDFDINQNFSDDCTLFSVYTDIPYATRHGVVVSDTTGNVQSISYCADEEYLMSVARNDKVQIVSGIVYFPAHIAEKLLCFLNLAPLNCCTYMGVDAGSEPLKMSLFFDILVAMIRSITQEDYLSGQYGNKYNVKAGLDDQGVKLLQSARKVIWAHLSRFTLKSVALNNLRHCYWDERLSAQHHVENLFHFGKTGCFESFLHCKDLNLYPRSLIINTVIECDSFSLANNSILCNSKIRARKVSVGNNCLLSSVHIELPQTLESTIFDNICVLGFQHGNNKNDKIVAVFESTYDLQREVDVSMDKYCGVPWNDFLAITGLSCDDIWDDAPKTIWNAKLFCDIVDITFYLQIFSGNYEKVLKLKWKDIQRFSLQQLVNNVNTEHEVLWRQELLCDVICSQISYCLEKKVDKPFLHFFKLACANGWHTKILNTLDMTAEKVQNKQFELCRTLSCIADLLGTMAGTVGRVRSGPGNNKAWIPAFDYLRKDDPGKAIKALKEVRQKWLDSNLVIRAARHYESALQVFIQHVVKTAKKSVNLFPGVLPNFGHWVMAECPARVDLQGGWSDTPPICYEQGGSVVNIAVLVDGKKPVGAMVKRTVNRTICLKMRTLDFSSELEVKSLSDLSDFNQVYANCALLKAAIVCTELCDLSSSYSLEEQLEKFGSGFELCSWSLLPQGSGLGTSSILAGAIIAALWTASGRTYSKNCILHAVLYLEQLLTTGGGWQDQVGGIVGGVNRGYSLATTPMEVRVEHIPIGEKFLSILNDHLFLIYTGKVRLAKNLLQNVIRNWYACEENVVKCFRELVENSLLMAEAFKSEHLDVIGEQMNRYWEQKKILASGCEPADVKVLMKHLNPLTYGKLLVGAGGGGFMCILTKEPSTIKDIQDRISELPFSETLSVHSITVDLTGLTVKVNGNCLNLS